MRKSILSGTFTLALLLGFSYLSTPTVEEYLTEGMAAAVGIDMWAVYDFEKQRGLRRELAVGTSGEDVRLVQEALAVLHDDFPEENITGYFGNQTSVALAEYQNDHDLPHTGVLDVATRESINAFYFNELCPDGHGARLDDALLTHVNKEKPLPKQYLPEDLIDVSEVVKTTNIVCLRKDVAIPLKKMFKAASKDGLHLAVTSGFRKPEIQNVLYWIWTAYEGEDAKDHVAEPRHSEHQLGTTLDLTGASNGNKSVDPAFSDTPEAKWLEKHAYTYGFVMSYPEGKRDITGYDHEPWHYRYVGKEHARTIIEDDVTLEEYLDAREPKGTIARR